MDHAPGEELRQQRQRVIGAAAAVTLLVLLPVLAARHLPLMDAPAHEARLAFLRAAIFSGQPSAFYALGSFFLPDIAFDAIGTMLVPLAGPEGAARIFFALTLALQLWGILVLNRVATGRWSAVPLFGIEAIPNKHLRQITEQRGSFGDVRHVKSGWSISCVCAAPTGLPAAR